MVLGCNRIGWPRKWVTADTGASNRSKHVGQAQGRGKWARTERGKGREARWGGEGSEEVGERSAEPTALCGCVPECPRTLVKRKRASRACLTAVGFEHTPFRSGALSQCLRPLGQTVDACRRCGWELAHGRDNPCWWPVRYQSVVSSAKQTTHTHTHTHTHPHTNHIILPRVQHARQHGTAGRARGGLGVVRCG